MAACAALCVSLAANASDSLRLNTIRTVQAESTTTYGGYLTKDTTRLSFIASGDWFSINTGDLGAGIDTITILHAKEDVSAASIEIRQGSLNGPIIAGGTISSTGSLNRYVNSTYLVDALSGENEIFFVFTGGGTIGHIDNIKFGRSQQHHLQAESSFRSSGVTTALHNIEDVNSGDWLQFKNVQLGNGFSQVSLRYTKADELPSQVTLHLDNLNGPTIGTIDLPGTNNLSKRITAGLTDNNGTHDIFARFSGTGEVSSLDYISLAEQPLATRLTLANASVVRGMNYFENDQFLETNRNFFRWFKFDKTSVSYNPKIEFQYAHANDLPIVLEVRENSPRGRIVGTLDLPNTGSEDNFETISTRLTDMPEGIYNLSFSLVGDGLASIGDIDLIRIGDANAAPLGEIALDKIVVDQFGYRPEMEKVAILRDAQLGFGSLENDYIAGSKISLVNEDTHEIVLTAAPDSYLNGQTDSLSGDRAWSFDFSEFETPGTYYVYDADNNARSASFDINENIYDDVLKEAFRTFVYQRSGFDKTADIVGEDYVDTASHTGPLQDSGARLYNRRNRSTERDLNGGWYDAGDFKKYSNWTADYILGLLHAYHANPSAWSDDWNLPESGNGVPDILDEVRWGVEHLQRMQETSNETNNAGAGSVLSVLDSDDSVSPASANIENSFYGPASTSATFTSAAAYAFAASTFETIPDQTFQDLAESLTQSAISAYQWAESNPNVRFNNSENGVGNGNSEVSSNYMLEAKHRIAAIYLYGLTTEAPYKNYIESNYLNTNLMTVFWATPYEVEEPTALLHYTTLDGINPAIGSAIQTRFNNLMENAGNGRSAIENNPYRAYVQEYAWGSNKAKSRKGHMYTQLNSYDLGVRSAQENLDAAAGYLHYIHGVNPLGKVYLTNMGAFGAERSVDEIYHRWFANDTQWDNVNTSFGPPPGYLVGGPNQFYNGSLDINQPPMKSYVETNAYLNGEASWQLTENSNGYQIEYLKLLSQFVD